VDNTKLYACIQIVINKPIIAMSDVDHWQYEKSKGERFSASLVLLV